MPLIEPNPIESARLWVRPINESDLPALMEVNGDAEVTRFLPYATWQSLDDARAWFKRMSDLQASGSALQFVVTTKATGKAIGTCLLFRFEAITAPVELGYVLGQAYWGRGYMREALAALINGAFNQMSLRTLEAEVDLRNIRSTRLLLSLGFDQAGLPRQHRTPKGEATEGEIYHLHHHAWPGVLLKSKQTRH